jgi:putative endonuclease
MQTLNNFLIHTTHPHEQKSLGKHAEILAAQHLITQGYQILVHNYRYRKAEIDLIAQKEQLLCFIEVKARTSLQFGYPETFVKSYQRNLIKRAAENYIYTHHWNYAIRFDIISILQKRNVVELTHFEDAFI